MRWVPALVGVVCVPLACFIGSLTTWYVGLGLYLVFVATTTAIGYSAARCPKCGQVWGIGVFWWAGYCGAANELGTFVCRSCRLDIGLGLRD